MLFKAYRYFQSLWNGMKLIISYKLSGNIHRLGVCKVCLKFLQNN